MAYSGLLQGAVSYLELSVGAPGTVSYPPALPFYKGGRFFSRHGEMLGLV